MIEKTKKFDIMPAQGLDNTKRGIKSLSVGRSFHQILNETETQQPDKTIILDSLQNPSQYFIRHNTTTSANYEKIIDIVFKHEGKSFVKEDAGRESSKFGILAGTARQYGYKGDIASMTKEDAEQIYKKLWDKSGAEALPYPLSLVHFDTFINSPSAARRILQRSEGDVEKYLSLRQERYNRLAELRPERFAKYIKGWTNRINNLRTLVAEEGLNSTLTANPLQTKNVASNYSPINSDKALF